MAQPTLKIIGTKLDKLAEVTLRVSANTITLQEDMNEVKERLAKMDTRFDTLESNQDWMIGKLTTLDQERLSMIQTLRDYGERIERLEAQVGVGKP